jgi:hypothetical protein
MRQYNMTILKLNLEHRVRQCLQDFAFYFDNILLRHVFSPFMEIGWAKVI